MDKDLKQIIDTVEIGNQSDDELELLKEQIQSLSFVIRDQKSKIKNLKNQINLSEKSEIDIPEDVRILKEMIISQRREIIEKDKDIDVLQQTVNDLRSSTENSIVKEKVVDNEEFIKAQKEIEQLRAENEMLMAQVGNLKSLLNKFHSQSTKDEHSRELKTINNKVNDLKSSLIHFQGEIDFIGQNMGSLDDSSAERSYIIHERERKFRINSAVIEENKLKIEGLKHEINNLEQQKVVMQEDLDNALNSNRTLSERLNDTLKELESQNTIEPDSSILEKKSLQFEELTYEVSILEQQKIVLQDDLDNALQSNRTLSEQLNNTLKELQSLKNQLNELIEKTPQVNHSEELNLMNLKIQHELNIEDLNKEIEILNQQNIELQVELNNAKTMNKTMSERLEHSTNQIKSLVIHSQEIQENKTKDNSLEALELTNNKIQKLSLKNKDLNRQIAYLRQEIENLVIKPESSYNEMELMKYKKENQKLVNIILKLKKVSKPSRDTGAQLSTLPKHYQNHIFRKMFDLLSEKGKNNFIEMLIQDLQSSNNGIKKSILTILSEFQNEKVFYALVDLIHDNDWLIRFNAIKALSRFDRELVKNLAEELMNDPDIDVREAAEKLLR